MKTSGMNIDEFKNLIFQNISDILPEVYVITNGVDVADIVLEENIAKHMCSRMNSSTDETWIYGNVDSAIKYAFRAGYETGRANYGKDSELRSSNVQEEQE